MSRAYKAGSLTLLTLAASLLLSMLGGCHGTTTLALAMTWTAPAPPPVGTLTYNVLCSENGEPYTVINSAPITTTSYVLTPVEAGATYDCYAESYVNGIDEGVSNVAMETVP